MLLLLGILNILGLAGCPHRDCWVLWCMGLNKVSHVGCGYGAVWLRWGPQLKPPEGGRGGQAGTGDSNVGAI